MADSQNSKIPHKKAVAAFFDFDKTLIAKDSCSIEAEKVILLRSNWTNISSILSLMFCVFLDPFVNRNWIFSTEFLNKVYFNSYAGYSIEKLQSSANKLYKSSIKPELYQDMLDIMNNHKKQGHLVFVVSATSEHLIEPFAREYSDIIDAWKSTTIEKTVDGICTGGLIGKVCCGTEKARVVQEIAKEFDVDLQECFGYSDHHHDLPMLELFGNPITVNPTPVMESIAQKRGWEILRPSCKVL